jgi:hypothetical protein
MKVYDERMTAYLRSWAKVRAVRDVRRLKKYPAYKHVPAPIWPEPVRHLAP